MSVRDGRNQPKTMKPAGIMPNECPKRAKIINDLLGIKTEVMDAKMLPQVPRSGYSRTTGRSIYKR